MENNFSGQPLDQVRNIYLIEGGIVTNFVSATPQFILDNYGGIEAAFISDLLPSQPSIGWSWTSGGGFVPPPAPPAPVNARQLYVRAEGWDSDVDPNKYFSRVSDAVASAEAMSPPPSNINPVLILVYPGRYTEDVTLSRSGVHIASIPEQRAFATQIVGTVTVNLGAGIDRDINFVSITGINFTRLVFTGANPQKLYIQDCAIESSSAAHTMVMDNTGVDTGSRKSQVIAANLTVRNSNAGAFRCIYRTGGDLEVVRGFIRKAPDTEVAVELAGAGTPGTGFVTFSQTDIDGRVLVSGNSPLTITVSDVSTASAVAAAIESTSSGTVIVGDVSVGCGFATAILVAGALVTGDITFTGAGSGISAGVFVALTQFSPKFKYSRPVSASGAITAQDEILLGTGGAGGITLTVPLASTMPRRYITAKKVDAGVGAVTLSRSGANLIDGATTYALTAQYQRVTLYSDGTTWHVIGS